MIIEYLEFDLDTNGKSVMYITCHEDNVWHYYLGCGVYNNNGLKFDLNACEILGCHDSNGVEPHDIVANFIPARDLLEDCLSVKGVKTIIKDYYWQCYQEILDA